jgi:hypothetical protein
MPFPPQAFIIGAQRAGTTSLAELLNQHPEIELSNPKEPDFFSVHWEQGLDWYRSRFRRLDANLIDASVSYTMARKVPGSNELPDVVPRRIQQVSPEARFIYLVRDPAERCNSAYWHDVRAGREKRSLRMAVEQAAYYAMASYYHRQIVPFLHYFPLDRFLIVRFEDFAKDQISVADRCCGFLGLADHNYTFRQIEPKNQAFLYNSFGQVLRDMLGQKPLEFASRIASSTLPTSLHSYAKRIVARSVDGLSPDDRAWLADWFSDDVAAFARLTGVQVGASPPIRAQAVIGQSGHTHSPLQPKGESDAT